MCVSARPGGKPTQPNKAGVWYLSLVSWRKPPTTPQTTHSPRSEAAMLGPVAVTRPGEPGLAAESNRARRAALAVRTRAHKCQRRPAPVCPAEVWPVPLVKCGSLGGGACDQSQKQGRTRRCSLRAKPAARPRPRNASTGGMGSEFRGYGGILRDGSLGRKCRHMKA